MSSPPEPIHAAVLAGEASEPEKEPQEQERRPDGTRVCSVLPRTRPSSGRVTRSQAQTSSDRNSAANNPIAAPCHRALDGAHHPHTSHSPLTDHSGAAIASPTRTWASAAERQPHTPTPTPNLQKTGDRDSSHTEGIGANTVFPLSALPTSPTDNYGNTRPPTPLMDNTGDVRHQGPSTQEATIATLGSKLEALAKLQADNLQKPIGSLQGVSFWYSNLSRYGHGAKTYRGGYFLFARNTPKWVLITRKNLSPIDGKETFHVYRISP